MNNGKQHDFKQNTATNAIKSRITKPRYVFHITVMTKSILK